MEEMDKIRKEAKRKMMEQIKISPLVLKQSVEKGYEVEKLFIAKGEAILMKDPKAKDEELMKINMNIQAPEARAISLLTAVADIIIKNNTEEVLQKLLDDVSEERAERVLRDIDNFAKSVAKDLNDLDQDTTGFSPERN